jgi:hypothetical protein
MWLISFCGPATQRGSWPPHSSSFLDHTQRSTTVGRTPLDEWSAHRRDLYLTTQHSQQTNTHATGDIRTYDLSRQAAANLRLRPRGHWDRLAFITFETELLCGDFPLVCKLRKFLNSPDLRHFTTALIYRFIQNYCWGLNNLSHTIHLR